MIETIFNWITENFGDPSKYVPVEFQMEDAVSFDDMEYDEVSSYDAMSCSSCHGIMIDNSVPAGKQVI